MRHSHLDRAAAAHQSRVQHQVLGHVQGVLQVALDLVEDVFGGAAEEDRACLWVGNGVVKMGKVLGRKPIIYCVVRCVT